MKFFKKFAVIFAAVVATVFLAAFATACGDKEDDVEYATTTFTVIVQDENGNPIDPTDAKWENDAVPDLHIHADVRIQFCAVLADGSLGSCDTPYELDATGKATVNLETVKGVAEDQNTNMVEMHILSVESEGYTDGKNNGAYGRYEVDKIPLTITIQLKKKAA